jgi:hypothetical protein
MTYAPPLTVVTRANPLGALNASNYRHSIWRGAGHQGHHDAQNHHEPSNCDDFAAVSKK